MGTLEWIRLAVGLAATVIVLGFAAKRVLFLTNLIRSGQPISDESGRKDNVSERFLNQFKEVFGQTRLLKWSLPGLAHFFTMWGFFILGIGVPRGLRRAVQPGIPHPVRRPLGRPGLPAGLLRRRRSARHHRRSRSSGCAPSPRSYGRSSRFYGSHTGGAWLILFMIFLVILTFAIFRGAAVNNLATTSRTAAARSSPTAWRSCCIRWATPPTTSSRRSALLGHIGVMLAFLLIVLHSKHLHIGLAPVNVTFKRLPDGLGPLLPMEFEGEPIDFEDPAEDATLGRGKIEDFTWKGYLDFATCTECGRCQSQCPAWNTGKPLSPKLVIMDLRDHLFAKAPYIIGGKPTPLEGLDLETVHEEAATTFPSPASAASPARVPSRPSGRWSAPPSRAA